MLFLFYALLAWEGTSNQASKSYTAHKGQSPSGQQVNESSGWYWLTHDATGFFTLGLIIVGLGQAGLFFWQLRLMREGLRDAKAAADAAKASAQLAKSSLDLTRDTSRRQLRAYILVDDVKFVQPSGETGRTYIDVILKNFGQTPCYDGDLIFEADICSEKLLDFVIPFSDKAERHDSVIIASGHTHVYILIVL
jgi:hypothetical protein